MKIDKVRPILTGPFGRQFTEIQIPDTPSLEHSRRLFPSTSNAQDDPFLDHSDLHSSLNIHHPMITHFTESDEIRQARQRRKKEKQWQRWSEEVIPSLIRPHLEHLRQRNDQRRNPDIQRHSSCTCGGVQATKIRVVCVFFESTSCRLPFVVCSRLTLLLVELEELVLDVCICSTAALQLMRRGLFPCSPVRPTLAVDLNLLEFVKKLFVNTPPNVTGWCHTLESFLGERKYKLTTRAS